MNNLGPILQRITLIILVDFSIVFRLKASTPKSLHLIAPNTHNLKLSLKSILQRRWISQVYYRIKFISQHIISRCKELFCFKYSTEFKNFQHPQDNFSKYCKSYRENFRKSRDLISHYN